MMGRHKKNPETGLVKSGSMIMAKQESLVSRIKNSDEISEYEKSYILEQLEVLGALGSDKHRLELKDKELAAQIKRLDLVQKRKTVLKLLKETKGEITMANNKIIGYTEMLQRKIEGGEFSENGILQLTVGENE